MFPLLFFKKSNNDRASSFLFRAQPVLSKDRASREKTRATPRLTPSSKTLSKQGSRLSRAGCL